jgi:hypothetical protein
MQQGCSWQGLLHLITMVTRKALGRDSGSTTGALKSLLNGPGRISETSRHVVPKNLARFFPDWQNTFHRYENKGKAE